MVNIANYKVFKKLSKNKFPTIIRIFLDRLKPKTSFGRIDNDTELIINPNTNQQNDLSSTRASRLIKDSNNVQNKPPPISRSKTISEIPSNQSSLIRSTTLTDIKNHENNILNNSIFNRRSNSSSNTSIHNYNIEKMNRHEIMENLIKDLKKENRRNFEFRVITGKWENSHQISDIFVTKNNLPEFMDLDQIFTIQTLNDYEYYVNVKVIAENELFPNNIYNTIEINENLMKLLKIKEFDKIQLQPKLTTIINFIEKIELYSNKRINYKLLENSFKNYILNNTKLSCLLLNQNQILKLEDDIIVTVHLIPEHFKYCLLNSQILKENKIYASDEIKNVDEILDIENNNDEEDTILSVKDLIHIQNFDDIVLNIKNQLIMNLCLNQTNSILKQGNILIAGKKYYFIY